MRDNTVIVTSSHSSPQSVPKVSPPVSSSGPRQTGNVLDKIQVMMMIRMMMMMMIMI